MNFSKLHMNRSHKINYNFGKILVLHKVTRLEYERTRNPNLSEADLKAKLEKRGSNYERLVEQYLT